MATINKVGTRKWRVRWDEYDKDGARHTRSKSFDSAAAAKAYRTQVETGAVARIDADIAFSDYAAQWLAGHEALLEVSSRKMYRHGTALAIKYFGRRKLHDIRPSDIERYAVELGQPDNGITARALAHKSVKSYVQVLSIMLNDAVRDDIIHRNPRERAKLPPAPKREKVTLDLDAIRAGVEALKGTPEYIPACLALYGGLRQGECLGLKWADIDFDSKQLTVRHVRQLVQSADERLNAHTHYIDGEYFQIEKECPKNGSMRTFIMPDALLLTLKDWQRQQLANRLRYGKRYHVTDYVCTLESGKLMSPYLTGAKLRGVCTFHQLRHAHISWLLDAGVPVTEVARRVGHSNTHITLDVYAHASLDQDKKAAAALSAL